MAVHVLIVDADMSAAAVTHAIVKRVAPEATVVCESTSDRGWLSIQQMTPDVLIIDPVVQGPGGTLLIQLCKEEHPAMRIVVLASLPTPALRATVKRLNIDVYLEKPAAMAALADKLRTLILSREAAGLVIPLPNIHHP
ncbi:MAG TPA: response regulator [Herpetosiphonaceae bacterium]